MQLLLYVTNDNENVINKELSFKHELDVNMKDKVDIINPTLILSDNSDLINFLECNYCEIPDYKRTYFIRSVNGNGKGLFKLELECDVLETFKDDILNSVGEVQRKLRIGDYMDSTVNVDLRKEIEIHKSPVKLVKDNRMILSTIGGR